MKRTVVLAALASASICAAAAQFEGVASFKITMNQGRGQTAGGTATMYLTKTAYRSEFEIGMGAAGDGKAGGKGPTPRNFRMTMFAKLSDPGKLTMLNDENKTYSIWDAKTPAEDAKNFPKESYTVKRLGSGTVAGLSCEKALVTSSRGNEFEVCMSPELGASTEWIAAMNRRQKDSASWIKALHDAGVDGFPIRWAMKSPDSKEPSMVMELTSLQKKTLPASLFEIPAGYRKTDMAVGGLTPAQEKAMSDAKAQMEEALENLPPEQRKAYEDMMKRYGQPTPEP